MSKRHKADLQRVSRSKAVADWQLPVPQIFSGQRKTSNKQHNACTHDPVSQLLKIKEPLGIVERTGFRKLLKSLSGSSLPSQQTGHWGGKSSYNWVFWVMWILDWATTFRFCLLDITERIAQCSSVDTTLLQWSSLRKFTLTRHSLR